MRALVYVGGDVKLEWQDRPDVRLQGDLEAVVRPIASSPCDLDRTILSRRSPFAQRPGFAIGHECVAEVLDVGDKVHTVRPGDVVILPFSISCGVCVECRAGLQAHCTGVPGGRGVYGVPGERDWGGLFSDQVRVPYADAMLTPAPTGVDPAYLAAVSDNLTDAYMSVRRGLQKNPGGRVLVLGGAESFGLFATDSAMAAGASRVDYCDADPARRLAAQNLGAEVLEALPPDADRRYHLVIFASREITDLVPAIRALRPNGHCHLLTMFFDLQPVPLWEMFVRDASLSIGLPSVKTHIHTVANLVKCGHLHPERLITIREEADAIEALCSPAIKPVIVRPRLG
jgi:threonine dehydrogenase-like Zn-dependent dehydrogenase